MLEEKIKRKRKQLNESIEKKQKYEDVYKLSVELDDLITEFYKKSKEKENNRKVFHSIGILTIFVVILSFIALLASSAADIYNRRYDIGVMYIHGIRKIHIFMIQ